MIYILLQLVQGVGSLRKLKCISDFHSIHMAAAAASSTSKMIPVDIQCAHYLSERADVQKSV